MITIPKEIAYCELYFTLKCNLNCPYCINAYGKLTRPRNEMSAKDLAGYINNIMFDNIPLTIGGGEPTLRKDFYEFISLLRPDIKIDLLSNLSFDIDEFTANIPPSRFYKANIEAYKSIRVSYHPSQMDANALIAKAKAIQDNGYNIGIFGISHPQNVDDNIAMSEISRKNMIYFFMKDFLGRYNGQLFGYYKDLNAIDGVRKTCKCRTNEILLTADGYVWKCHRDLYSTENPVGNIKDSLFEFEYKYRDCDNYGECNPCDIKLKTNRFLNDPFGRCATEIKKTLPE